MNAFATTHRLGGRKNRVLRMGGRGEGRGEEGFFSWGLCCFLFFCFFFPNITIFVVPFLPVSRVVLSSEISPRGQLHSILQALEWGPSHRLAPMPVPDPFSGYRVNVSGVFADGFHFFEDVPCGREPTPSRNNFRSNEPAAAKSVKSAFKPPHRGISFSFNRRDRNKHIVFQASRYAER